MIRSTCDSIADVVKRKSVGSGRLEYGGQRSYLEKPNRPPLLSESWAKQDGKLVRYSLAYIDFNLYRKDNGRVLGYDNAHGFHERHLIGRRISFSFKATRPRPSGSSASPRL